jgi:hypothetical protein
MTPKTRADLALMVPRDGTTIELGVAAGKFAEELLTANQCMRYIGIDRWSDHHDLAEMHQARAKLWRWRDRCRLVRATFYDHLPSVADQSANLIYIDGYAHTGQEGGQTLRDWWPKLKAGGIFAGHDYCPQYQPTIEAVDSFVAEKGLILNVIDESPHPSWWIRKTL